MSNLAIPKDVCLDTLRDQWKTEVYLPEWIMNSPHYTKNPEEAHMFIIPAYIRCLYREHRLRYAASYYKSKVYTSMAKYIHSNYYFKRKFGYDHLVIIPGGSSGSVAASLLGNNPTISEGLGFYSNVTKITPESYYPSWYFPGEDIVIPGMVTAADFAPDPKRTHYFDVEAKRSIVVLYIGDFKKSAQRQQIGKLAMNLAKVRIDSPDAYHNVIIQDTHVEDYATFIHNCSFCLVPRGTSPWTIRFYESLLTGCIPVLLGRDFYLPFRNHIDWEKFVVSWPEDTVGVSTDLVDFLLNVPEREIIEKRRIIAKISPLLVYRPAPEVVTNQLTDREYYSDSPIIRRDAYYRNAYTMAIREIADRYCYLKSRNLL